MSDLDEIQLLSVFGTLISLIIAIFSFYSARKKEAVTSKEELDKQFKNVEFDYIARIQALSDRRDEKLEKMNKERDEKLELLNRDRDKKLEELAKRITDECGERFHLLDNRLKTIEVKIDPLWDAIIKEIPKLLISPHTPQLDGLLRKGISGGWECLEPQEVVMLDELIDKEMASTRLNMLGANLRVTSKEAKKASARLAAFAAVKAAVKAQRDSTTCEPD